jgi:hypothetical protein
MPRYSAEVKIGELHLYSPIHLCVMVLTQAQEELYQYYTFSCLHKQLPGRVSPVFSVMVACVTIEKTTFYKCFLHDDI